MVRLLVFDFDSTLIKDESLVSMLKYTLEHRQAEKLTAHQIENAEKQIQEITLQGIAGKISMIESYRRRLSIAKPSKNSVEQYLENSSHLPTNGIAEVIDRFRSAFPDVPIHVISQGPRIVVSPLCEQAFKIPAENIHAVDLVVGDENEDIDYIAENEPMLSRGKTNTLEEIVKREEENQNNKQKQIVVVGDGVSDMKMKVDGVATTAIGFGLHLQFPETKKLCDYYVTEVDQLYPILEGLFCEEQLPLDTHIRDNQVFNFFAGPATMPTSVLQHVNNELLNYEHRLGYSVLEMSHRSKDFDEIINSTTANLRHLL
jgi:HAD superfamily phosphoserine phosphatase-like hydrolase